MTVIPINSKYRIELDQYAWQVSKLGKDKKAPGGMRWAAQAWYPRLDQCCEWLIQHGLSDAELESAEAVIRELKEMQHSLRSAIEKSPIENIALREHKRLSKEAA